MDFEEFTNDIDDKEENNGRSANSQKIGMNSTMAMPDNKPGMKKYDPTSLVVTHLPTTEISKRELEEFFGQIGPIRKCHLVRDKDWQFKGMVYVQYMSSADAAIAQKTLNRKQFRGSALKVKFSRNKKKEREKSKVVKVGHEKNVAMEDEHFGEELQERPRKQKRKNRNKYDVNKEARKMKKGRLILRNLSFKVDEEAIKEHFSPYGKITEIKMIKKEDMRNAGYAFIQYETKLQALKAVKECNMKPLIDRPVVVDFAVSKKQYVAQTIKVEDLDGDVKEEKIEIKQEVNENDVKTEISDNFDYTKVKIKEEKLSDEEDSDSGLEDEDDTDSEESDDSDEDESEDEKPKPKGDRKPESKLTPSKDVEDERTVFIKNLSFDATDEDIGEVLSKFGELKYVLLCMDRLTEHPRGTAFAQFKTREAATACLAAEADPTNKDQFIVLGRPMHIMKAVSRGNLQDRRNEKESEKVKDKRNLYLAREGFVRAGTQAAVGVSQADMNLRQMREQVKRRMLRNLNIFVSPTRLCINNLPKKLTDLELRNIFKKHGKITEARIMRNLKEIGDDGKPVSRGYGFVNFVNHDNALAALRKLNNNPTVFTDLRRPVIEFSLENREIIQVRKKRLEKSKEKNPTWNEGKGGKNARGKGKNQLEGKPGDTNEVAEGESFMGAKSDPSAGVKNALPSNIGPKIRHRGNSGKITRKQLKKQRLDRQKGHKRLRVCDEVTEEPIAKKSKEEQTTKKNKNKNKKKHLPKTLKAELRRDKSFNDMVKQYKQKMSSVNTESSNKKWYED